MMLYKVQGSKWSKMTAEFPEMSENDIKNKFYSSLKSVANKIEKLDKVQNLFLIKPTPSKDKKGLIQYVDIALTYEKLLPCDNDLEENKVKRLKKERTRNSKRKSSEPGDYQLDVWPTTNETDKTSKPSRKPLDSTIFSKAISQMVWEENEVNNNLNSGIIKTN